MSSDIRIITDHKWKPLKSRSEVPDFVLDREFDYLDEDDFDGFFTYRRTWYHISEFEVLSRESSPFVGHGRWDGYHGDSFFSGVLIELSGDGEMYRVGTYFT